MRSGRTPGASTTSPNAKVPLLVLHPEDDPIVKVEQARMLAEAAKDNDLVRVWILPAGSHGLLEAADPNWTHAVYRTFFERWATYAERTVRAGQRARPPSWFTPRRSPGSASHADEEANEWTSDILRRLIWAGLLAATGALATVAAHRLSEVIWRRVFNEEPPE